MPKEYTLIGGNGTVVSPLTVTENGTYTAGDSKAFNPVIVNVEGSSSPLSTFAMTATITGSPSCSGLYALDDDGIRNVDTLQEGNESINVIAVDGVCQCVFETTAVITTYSGGISLGEAELDEGVYWTPATITGDCAVTLVGPGVT